METADRTSLDPTNFNPQLSPAGNVSSLKEIDALSQEIRKARLRLTELEAELRRRLKAVLSIDRIPEEILGNIIESTLPRILGGIERHDSWRSIG
jgi:hypothetical protein